MVLTAEDRKQHKKESARKWRDKNREKIKEAKLRWYWKHREERRLEKKQWWIKNKEKLTKQRKIERIELKKTIIQHYSKQMKCAQCGLADLKNLTVDHINGGGERHRKNYGLNGGGHAFYRWLKRKNFPKGYQILCFGCNMEKGGRIGSLL